MNDKADIEVLFFFNGRRETDARSGYRPAHRIKDNYFTTGIHFYYTGMVKKNGIGRGTITFLSPNLYPHCLWIGKRIPFFEGERLMGTAIVTRIFNKTLEKSFE